MTPGFWIILLAVLLYVLVHTWLASLDIKALAQHWLGDQGVRWFRLLYNLVAILTLLPVLLLPVIMIDRHIYTIPFPWIILSGAIQLLAVVALVVGLIQTGIWSFLGLSQMFEGKVEKPVKLVINGLYRWVRHPLYLAGLIFIWLNPMMSWNLLAINLGATLYILAGAMIEERKLVVEFGDEYVAYRQRTPMLVPGLSFVTGLFHKSER